MVVVVVESGLEVVELKGKSDDIMIVRRVLLGGVRCFGSYFGLDNCWGLSFRFLFFFNKS